MPIPDYPRAETLPILSPALSPAPRIRSGIQEVFSKHMLSLCVPCLTLPPPTAEILQRKTQFSLPLPGSCKQHKETAFLFPTGPRRYWEDRLPQQAYNCAHRPGMTSNKAVEAKWPSLSEIKTSGKASRLNLNYTSCYCKVGVCFSRRKTVWKMSRPVDWGVLSQQGQVPFIQQWALPASEPPVEQDKRPKTADHTGCTLRLGFQSCKVMCCIFFFQPTIKVSFVCSMVQISPHSSLRL